eukprot:5440994-Pleurochrysis_carterae.AAC.4
MRGLHRTNGFVADRSSNNALHCLGTNTITDHSVHKQLLGTGPAKICSWRRQHGTRQRQSCERQQRKRPCHRLAALEATPLRSVRNATQHSARLATVGCERRTSPDARAILKRNPHYRQHERLTKRASPSLVVRAFGSVLEVP